MKKLTILLIATLAIIMSGCAGESNSNAVTEKGNFVTAAVTRGGANAKIVAWDVNAAQNVEYTCESEGEKAIVTVTLTGKTAEKPEGEVKDFELKLTPKVAESEMPHSLPATAESMAKVKEAVGGTAGGAVEVTFKGEMKMADAAKMNNSTYFVNVVMP